MEEDSTNNNNQESNPAQGNHRQHRRKGTPGKTQHWTHSHPIHPRTGGKLQEDLWKIWNPIHLRGNRPLKQVLVKPKDQDPKEKKSGVIYSYQCGEITCNEEYIGKTSRTLGERYRKHLKKPFPIHVHSLQTGHNATPENFNILGRKDQDLARTINESIYIRVNNPTLKKNTGSSTLIISGTDSFLTPLGFK